MSTDTSKESEIVDAAGEVEETAPARPSGGSKKKPVRRVRVIEVIDDGELDDDIEEVLSTLDAADDADQDEEEPEPKPVRRKTGSAKAAAATSAKSATGKKPSTTDADEDEAEEKAEPAAKTPRTGGLREQPVPGGLVTVGVLVVLLAVTASLAIWKWSQQASLSSDKADRAAAGKVAADFGASIFTYDSDHLQAELDHTAGLMTGDLKTRFAANQQSVKDTFAKNPAMKLSAKASKVYVGDVNGKFVTALVQLDANLAAGAGSALPTSSGIFVITLAKVGGTWKVSDMATTDPNAPSGASNGVGGLGQIGGTPSATPSATPSK